MTDPTPYDLAVAYAAKLGYEHGTSAATWLTDGNTTAATYSWLAKGIEDGDPEVLDTFPSPDLSGEIADGLSGPDLVTEALGEAGLNSDDGYREYEVAEGTWFTDICEAYEMAFLSGVQDEVARACAYQLTDS